MIISILIGEALHLALYVKQPTTIQTAYNKTAHVEATSWKASDDKNSKSNRQDKNSHKKESKKCLKLSEVMVILKAERA